MLPLFFSAVLFLAGCNLGPDKVVDGEVVPVACGTCIYKIPEGQGCYWAIELDGQHYPMAGTFPEGHDSHGPEGMCNMERQAKVSGELRGTNFVASSFELLPAKDVPTDPKFTPEDEHGADYKGE